MDELQHLVQEAEEFLLLAKTNRNRAIELFNALSEDRQLELIHLTPPGHRKELLYLTPDCTYLVQAMKGIDLFFTIQAYGKESVIEIIACAKAKQIAQMMDLECWMQDKLHIGSVLNWLEILLEVPDEKFLEFVLGLDSGFLALALGDFLDLAGSVIVNNKININPDNLKYDEPIIEKFCRKLYLQDAAYLNYIIERIFLNYEENRIGKLDNTWLEDNLPDALQARSEQLAEMDIKDYDEAQKLYWALDEEISLPKLETATVTKELAKASNKDFLGEILEYWQEQGEIQLLEKRRNEFLDLVQQLIIVEDALTASKYKQQTLLSKARSYISLGLDYIYHKNLLNYDAEELKTSDMTQLFRIGNMLIFSLKSTLKGYTPYALLISEFSEHLGALKIKEPQYYSPTQKIYRSFGRIAEIMIVLQMLEHLDDNQI